MLQSLIPAMEDFNKHRYAALPVDIKCQIPIPPMNYIQGRDDAYVDGHKAGSKCGFR